MHKVLLVDDDEAILQTLSLLRLEGVDIVGTALNGAEAVELAAKLAPDVVVMDLKMPVMDGIEATRLIKESNPSVQVIMHTAFDEPDLALKAKDVGAYGYLIKGCSRQATAQMIDEAAGARPL
ncbi:MAG: response regulator transcription factor [Actinomycetota bacterium]|nr:response regulator transcription factor [Actinomycetota bacterium]